MNKPISVPHRFSEEQFRFYEGYISLALKEFPACIRIDPANVQRSVETFAARFRDALTAKEEYGYKSKLFTDEEFDEKHKYLYVSIPIGTGIVLIGSRAAVKAAQQPGATTANTSVKTTPQTYEVVVGSDPLRLQLLCEMVGDKFFSPQPKFVVYNIDETHKQTLESCADISIVEDPVERGKFYIL